MPPTNHRCEPADRLRVVITQPSLAAYRRPVYRELAARTGIDLRVRYGVAKDIPNVEPEAFEATPAPITYVPVGRRRLMWQPAQLGVASRRVCDVAVYSWDAHYLSLAPALLRARASRVGTVLWGHGYSKNAAGWRDAWRTRLGRLADCLLFYNHAAATHHLDAGWPADRVFVAPNSLDQDPIQRARQGWLDRPDRLKQFQEEHDLLDRPVVLFVSRLSADNGLDLLLRAAARLLPRHPRLAVVIVGTGEPEMTRLQQLAANLQLGDAVRFPGAIYGEDRLAPYFLSARAFCYPQNIGLSLLHAFGYGLPVVTSDLTEAQNPEIEALENGRNGVLYTHGDIDALATAVQRLIDDPSAARRLGEAGRQTVAERFSLPNMVDGMEAAIRRAIELRSG